MNTDRIVYIVDDDPAVLSSVAWLMHSQGLLTECFGTVDSFLSAANLQRPGACLVLDVWMPGRSGLELLETLDARKVRLPTIIMTGHEETESAEFFRQLGAIEFLRKPFPPGHLLQAVERALGPCTDAARVEAPSQISPAE
jgi:two-component system response regulator FixJ